MHHVRSNSSRCKTNRFLCFFFRAFGWKSVLRLEVSRKLDPPLGNTSTSTYTYYQLYLYAIFHLPLLGAATVVKGAISASCVSLEVHTHKSISVLSFYFAARRLSVCDQSCPRNLYSLLVRGLFWTNYKLGSGMQSDVHRCWGARGFWSNNKARLGGIAKISEEIFYHLISRALSRSFSLAHTLFLLWALICGADFSSACVLCASVGWMI